MLTEENRNNWRNRYKQQKHTNTRRYYYRRTPVDNFRTAPGGPVGAGCVCVCVLNALGSMFLGCCSSFLKLLSILAESKRFLSCSTIWKRNGRSTVFRSSIKQRAINTYQCWPNTLSMTPVSPESPTLTVGMNETCRRPPFQRVRSMHSFVEQSVKDRHAELHLGSSVC